MTSRLPLRIMPLLAISLVCQTVVVRAAEIPRVLAAGWEMEQVATEPNLVTPVGCCHDETGRLLVVECHTHFPPDDYDGPKVDRIYLFDDPDGDGTLDRQRIFYEGGSATMAVAALEDGWIAVATRSHVTRIRDTDGDDVADEREVLLTLETRATYPHNGLSGLAVGPNGYLYVGQGENLGEPYELVAADGSKQVGGGEGGNIFRCKLDGKQLERVATGFWNPFGIYIDPLQRLWTVGNDPDAMPPCRLIHVARGGDYGFQFRFGRAGTHPLQAWNGELPDTLPMAAGTGEAPCSVIGQGKDLWVTSWGDNRIERYTLKPNGASWTSGTEVIVQGDSKFRPVGMSVAPDGSIYVTDWVDRSYPVHKQGRLWRLKRKSNAPPAPLETLPYTDAEKLAEQLQNDRTLPVTRRLDALASDDPFLRQAAVTGLVQAEQLATLNAEQVKSHQQAVLAAGRWRELTDPESSSPQSRHELLAAGLHSTDNEVSLAAVRWATERQCTELLPSIREILGRTEVTPELFSAVIASIAYLETGSAARGKRDPAIEKLLIRFAADAEKPARLRSLAIQKIPNESEHPTNEQLGEWLVSANDRALSQEIVGLLSSRAKDPSLDQLDGIALNSAVDDQTRADALAGLAGNASKYASTLRKLQSPRNPDTVREEARRIARRTYLLSMETRPRLGDLDAWEKRVGSGGDPDAGRRVFFRTTCANCHAHSGRGAKTGPDLTTLGTMTNRRLLESILDPSKEIGPLFVPWQVVTVEGQVLTGLKLDKAGRGGRLRFQGADGNVFEVPLEDVEEQLPVKQSIMPAGLEKFMTLDEFRDLLAFLRQ